MRILIRYEILITYIVQYNTMFRASVMYKIFFFFQSIKLEDKM